MASKRQWTSRRALLATSLVPLGAVVLGLGALSALRAQEGDAPAADAPAAAAQPDPIEEARRERRELRERYRECIETFMGDSLRLPRTRFSVPPDRDEIRKAVETCRVLLEPGGDAPAPPERAPSTPPIA